MTPRTASVPSSIGSIKPDDPLAQAWARVRLNYAGLLAVASPETPRASLDALARAGWEVARQPEPGPDRGLYGMVALAAGRGPDRIHFCDLDRVLHWLERYPEELRDLPQRWGDRDLTMLLRSLRALASHPPCQLLTEGTALQVLAQRLSRPDVEAFSGSYLWSPRAAEAVANAPGPHDLRFYSEGIVAPFRLGLGVGSIVVEGLE